MSLLTFTVSGQPYIVDSKFVADISAIKPTEFGANAIVRDKWKGIHFIQQTMEQVADIVREGHERDKLAYNDAS